MNNSLATHFRLGRSTSLLESAPFSRQQVAAGCLGFGFSGKQKFNRKQTFAGEANASEICFHASMKSLSSVRLDIRAASLRIGLSAIPEVV